MDSLTANYSMPALLDTLDPNTPQCCPLCGNKTKLKQLRGHIGQHILFRSRGMEEKLLREVCVSE